MSNGCVAEVKSVSAGSASAIVASSSVGEGSAGKKRRSGGGEKGMSSSFIKGILASGRDAACRVGASLLPAFPALA